MKNKEIIHEKPSFRYPLRTLTFSADSVLLREHFHSEVELVFVESGEIACTVSDRELLLGGGQILLVERCVVHRLRYAGVEARVSYLQLPIDDVCDSLFPNASLFSYFSAIRSKNYGVFSQSSEIGRLFGFIKRELEEKKLGYGLSVNGSIFQLVALMAREGFIGDTSPFSQSGVYQRILPALRYAQEHYAEKVTLSELCGVLGTDKYNFCKQFKKATGVTFFDYLTFVRLKHAEELLLARGKTVTEIAMLCGFSTVPYFNRVFAARYGLGPTAYRKWLLG